MTNVMGDKWPSLTSRIASRDSNDDKCGCWIEPIERKLLAEGEGWVANGDLWSFLIFFFFFLSDCD